MFICQTPGNWGKLPGSFKNFWDAPTKFYLTENVNASSLQSFSFEKSMSSQLEFKHERPQDSQDVCAHFVEQFVPGTHVLTIVPGDENRIILSILLLP